MGEFPSGQRGQTVNLLSLTSVVRIHLPPPDKNRDCDTMCIAIGGSFSMLRKRLDTRVLHLPFARSIGVLKALLIFAVKTLFSDRLSRLIICFFPTAVFLNLLYLPSWRNHRTRKVHGGHLVEARGVDSRLRARSGAALTVPRTVIHFRPVRLPPHKKPPHTQGARRSFGGA